MSLENIELWGKCEGRDGRNGRPFYLMKVVWTDSQMRQAIQQAILPLFLGAPPIKQSLHCYKRLSWLGIPSENCTGYRERPLSIQGKNFYIPACWKSLVPGATIKPTQQKKYLQHHGCQQQHVHGQEHGRNSMAATAGSPSTVHSNSRKATHGDVKNLFLIKVIFRAEVARW